MEDLRECLQCGETRASIERGRIVVCGIMGGYETPELVDEWPRHRWADWTDKELSWSRVRPEAFERHRRTPATMLQWIACEDTVRGHIPATTETMEFASVIGQCISCGKRPGDGSDQS